MNHLRVGLRALCLLAAAAGSAGAQTITVDISSDDIDINWQTGTIADLPGPDGKISFSEALIASNNTPGRQTIAFAIPTSDWTLQFLYPGRAVLRTLSGVFFRAFDEVTIDGTTQTAFTGDTNPDGWEIAIYGGELYLNGDNSTLIGFDACSLNVTGNNGLVQGNTGGLNVSVFGGSGSTIQDNVCGTIKLDRSSNNVVVGNTTTRVRVLGGGPRASGNRIGGPTLAERNHITGYGTINGEGLPGGVTVQLFDTDGTLIENNWIGTTPDGLAQGSLASVVGIGFEGPNDNATVRDNRIAGILGHGQGPHHAGRLYGWAVLVGGTGSGITMTGNTIGLDANGAPVLGSVFGVDVGNSSFATVSGIRIGTGNPGEGNVVAGHLFNGITIGRSMSDVRLAGNSVYDNGALGIDLIPSGYGYGVTANDPLDADTGGNGLQNFPVLTAAQVQGPGLRVIGSLASEPSSSYTLEFFASPSCDASGNGEGELFLGSTAVITDGLGDAAFDVIVPTLAPTGWSVTSTATLEPLGASSEFSACVPIGDPGPDTYCTAKVNSQGCTPAIGSSGLPSASSSGPFLITADQVLNGKNGLLFYGYGSRAKPFQGGTLCVRAPLRRTPIQDSGGNPPPDDCSGHYSYDMGARIRSGVDANLTVGADVYAQYWSRDPAAPSTTGLTDGVHFRIVP